MYHGIGSIDKFLEIEISSFEKQILYLKKKNFEFVNCENILKYKKGNIVSIMFDDALESSESAMDYMDKYNLKYSIAVIEKKVGTKGYMTWKQLLSHKNASFVFHTRDHLDLTVLNDKELKVQIECIANEINRDIIVYPMGKYNLKVLKNIKKQKYIYGMTVLPFHISKNVKNYEIPRICINGYLSFKKYKLFVSRLGNIYLHLAFLKRRILGQNYLEK